MYGDVLLMSEIYIKIEFAECDRKEVEEITNALRLLLNKKRNSESSMHCLILVEK
jgi:hypothetical protein